MFNIGVEVILHRDSPLLTSSENMKKLLLNYYYFITRVCIVPWYTFILLLVYLYNLQLQPMTQRTCINFIVCTMLPLLPDRFPNQIQHISIQHRSLFFEHF